MGGVKDLVGIVIHSLRPHSVKVAMISPDEILVTIVQPNIYTAIVLVHVKVAVFNRKIFGTSFEFRRAAEISGGREKVWILARNPECHESTHGEARDSAVFTIGNGPVLRVNMLD